MHIEFIGLQYSKRMSRLSTKNVGGKPPNTITISYIDIGCQQIFVKAYKNLCNAQKEFVRIV